MHCELIRGEGFWSVWNLCTQGHQGASLSCRCLGCTQIPTRPGGESGVTLYGMQGFWERERGCDRASSWMLVLAAWLCFLFPGYRGSSRLELLRLLCTARLRGRAHHPLHSPHGKKVRISHAEAEGLPQYGTALDRRCTDAFRWHAMSLFDGGKEMGRRWNQIHRSSNGP